MALLAIDQGNTRTKCGMFSGGYLQRAWTVPTVKSADGRALAEATVIHAGISHGITIGLCTVVSELIPAWQAMAQAFQSELVILNGLSPTPLINAYATPETLGPDRLMAAVAAADKVGTPVIVASLGTATVVDAVSSDGRYLGGMIAPGVGVASRALAAKASALDPVDWSVPEAPIGRSTFEAMSSGLFYQNIGGVQMMVQAIRTQLDKEAPLVLTGEWAPAFWG